MCFSNADLDFFMDNIRIQMCGRDIKNVKSGKHLGHIISSRGSLVNFEPVIRDMKVRTNVIINQFCSTSWQSKVVLFNSQCVSLYGCQPWSLDDPRIEELCVARRVCCCRLLGQHSRTCSYLLPHIMDSPPIRHNVAKRTLIFFINGLNHPVQQISHFFKNVLLSCSSYMLSNVNCILQLFGIKYYDLFYLSRNFLIAKTCCMEGDETWQICIMRELLNISDGQMFDGLSFNL